MAYNIDPNAKNIWIRDPNNTEDLSPQTHTSAVYLDNGHTIEDELGKAKSLTDTLEANESINRITEDTYESPYYEAKLKGQTVVNLIQDEIDLKDDKEYTIPYTYDKSEAVNISNTSDAGTMHPVLEGQTLINYIQDPSKDAVVLPYQVPESDEYRIDNTKTNGALDLKMYGRTLQNLIEFDNIKTEVTSNDHVNVENNIIKFTGIANGTLNITFNTTLTKPNTTYTFIIETNIEIPDSKYFIIGFLKENTNWNSVVINKEKITTTNIYKKINFNNKKAIFTLTTTSNYSNYGIRVRYDWDEVNTDSDLPIEVKVVLLEGDYRNNICPAGFIDRGYYDSNNITSTNYDVTTDFIKVKPNTSYAAKFFKSPNFDYHFSSIDKDGLLVQYAFFDENKNFISRSSTDVANIYNTNILTPENCYYIKLWFAINENSSPGALIENNCVLIETTDLPSTITEYIPYNINENIPFFTGISHVTNPELTVSGENLCSGFVEHGWINETGLVMTDDMTGDIRNILTDFIKVKPNTKYAAKLFLGDGFNTGMAGESQYGLYMQRAFFDKNKNYLGRNTYGDSVTDKTFTTPDNCYYIKLWNLLDTNYPSLTENKCVLLETTENPSTITEYIPYTENKYLLDDYTNNTIELRSLPNGIRDEINLKTNTLTRKIKKVIFDGSEDELWGRFDNRYDTENYSAFLMTNSAVTGIKNNTETNPFKPIFCDKLPVTIELETDWFTDDRACIFQGTSHLVIKVIKDNDINIFRNYLSENPITVYYELEEPEIINLNPYIKDQNGNSLTKLSPYNTTTYLSTFKENEILPTIESFNPKYNVLIEPNTTYTLNLSNTTYTLTLSNSGTTSFSFKLNNTYYKLNRAIGGYYFNPKLVFTTSDNITDSKLEFIGHGELISKIMLLKGDYSSKTIPTNYIEGVGSSIPKTITVHNKNLFNHDIYLNINNFNSYKWDGITINGNSISGNIPANSYYVETKLFDNVLERNTTYTFSADCVNCISTILFYTISNSEYSYIMEKDVSPSTPSISFTTPDCNFYVRFRYLRRNTGIETEVENASVSNIQIEKGDTKTDYTAYSYSKYTLPDNLVLNKFSNAYGTFYDTYDVYSGKYTKNVEKFIIDGNNNINITKYNIAPDDANTYPDVSGFYVVLPERNKHPLNEEIFSNSIHNNSIINNNYNISRFPGYLDTNEECCSTHDGNYFKFAIKKSKLETDNVAGVKKYLSENPITLVYVRNTQNISYLTPKQKIYAKNTITNMTTLLENGNTKPLMSRRNNDSYNVILKPSTKYTIALDKRPSATSNIISYNLGGTVKICSINDRFSVITTPSTLNNNTLTIYDGIGVAISKPMILEGEGYNLDLPFVEGMVDVVAPKIKTIGENLFNINGNINEKYDWTLGNNNILKDNKIISKSNSSWHHGLGQKIKVQPGKKYLISYKRNNTAMSEIHLKNSVNHWMQFADNNTTLNKIITIPHFCNEILISFNSNTIGVNGEFWDVCIKQCDDIEDISSYKYMQNTLYTPDTLHLRSLPGGICDELDVNTGKLTQKIKKVILTGADDEEWYLDTTKTVTQVFEYIAKDAVANPLYIRCDKLPKKGNWEGDNEKIVISYANRTASDGVKNYAAIYMALNKTKASTVNELRSYLASNPITVYYMLKEPIISYIDTSTVSLGEIKVGHELGNGVCNSYNPFTNIYTKRVEYKHLDGSEDWMMGRWGNQINTIGFEFKLADNINNGEIVYYTENNYFSYYPHDGGTISAGFGIDKEGINIIDHVNGLLMRIRILRSKLVTEDVKGFKAWLAENPQDCYYEMVLPEILNKKPELNEEQEEYIGKSHPFAYKNGHIILESNYDGYSLYPSLEYKLVGNRQGQIEQTSKLIKEHEVKLSMLEQMLVKQIIEISYNNSILKLNIEGDE